jgi:hypothetical protein
MCRKLLFSLGLLLVIISSVSAVPIRVDLSDSGDVETDWIDWNAGSRQNDINIEREFVNEANFDNNFTIQFIKVDTRNRADVSDSIPLHDLLEDCFKEASAFDMVLKNLTPGQYTMTTYHHDPLEDVENDDGTINITVNDAAGTQVVVEQLQQSWGPEPTLVASATFTFIANGIDDVVITFEDNDDGIHNEAHLNGFELDILGVVYKAYGPNPPDGSLNPALWTNLAWSPGDLAVSHDVYFGDNFDDVNNGAESTFLGNHTGTFIIVGFPGFTLPDGLAPGATYYWRIDEVNEAEPNSPWKGDVWSFSVPPNTAYAPEPADGTEAVEIGATLTWTPGFGSKLHTVYFGDNLEEVENATEGKAQGTATYTPDQLKMAKTYYWRVDEFDLVETYKGQVWSFTTEGAVSSLDPVNGAEGVSQSPTLTWQRGVFGDTHEIYFGTDREAVKNADTSSPEYKGSGNLGSESYDTGNLEWNTTYYWRIDEANSTEADSPWTGPIWSFTTADFLIIDDMEAYNDLDPADPASNRIFNAWIDGFEDSTNGALVGYDTPPFAEQTIVHRGNQSMPFYYDNAAGKSEATLTLPSNRDWTVNGVETLSIWYIGTAANSAETMYVVLNDTAVIENDNPDASRAGTWTRWDISLQAFADLGVNLSSVNSITIGLGSRSNPVAGGSGTLFFDDIRLHRP